MKKITFITIVLLMALTSCSSDNNEVSTIVDCYSSVEGLSSYSEILPLPTEYYYDADYDECDDIDLSVQATYYTSEGNCIYITRDEYGNISGHDLNGNFISGYSD